VADAAQHMLIDIDTRQYLIWISFPPMHFETYLHPSHL
jgi:hypothetical protein